MAMHGETQYGPIFTEASFCEFCVFYIFFGSYDVFCILCPQEMAECGHYETGAGGQLGFSRLGIRSTQHQHHHMPLQLY